MHHVSCSRQREVQQQGWGKRDAAESESEQTDRLITAHGSLSHLGSVACHQAASRAYSTTYNVELAPRGLDLISRSMAVRLFFPRSAAGD